MRTLRFFYSRVVVSLVLIAMLAAVGAVGMHERGAAAAAAHVESVR